MSELFPHQRKVLKQIQDNPRPALFMHMRLGKTRVIIRWARRQTRLISGARILVVGPLSVLDDWIGELEAEGVPRQRISMLTGMPMDVRLEYAAGGHGWYLINYDAVRILERELADLDWDVVILDESTAIRNPQAKTTKVLVNQYQHIPYRAILTGDPRPESELDYFEQFRFLLGNFMSFGNYWAFRQAKFKQGTYDKWTWLPREGVRDEIKEYVHSHAIVLTKKQAGMFDQKLFERRVVEPNDAQRRAIRELVNEFGLDYIETKFATVRDVWLSRVAGGFSPDRDNPQLLSPAKIEELYELVTGELRHDQIVVWFRFNEELDATVKYLSKKGIRTAGVTGLTQKEKRYALREAFQAGKLRVLCVQVRLGRFGWNLSAADTAIYYSNALDFESRNQSQERIAHPTKKRPLLYIDLITRGSIDEEVVRLLREKHTNSAAFMRELNRHVLARLLEEYGEGKGKEKETARSPENQSRQTLRARRVYPAASEAMDL